MILMSKYKGKHGGKKGQKIRAGVSPPFSGNARKKIFFLQEVLPKVLKFKINHNLFSHKHGVPKLGGEGVLNLRKIPTFSLFFWKTSLSYFCY